MATFKVGQRVRIIKSPNARRLRHLPNPIGCTATITSIPSEDGRCDCGVLIDNFPPEPHFGSYGTRFYTLVPLTDPKAAEFIERIKKLKPEPVAPALPVRVKNEQ